jgi:hypothetical protein
MRSWRATHNLVAVSANARETAINTEQTLDTSMLVDMSDVANLEPRREDNAEELTGKEEADTIYDLGNLAALPFTFNKAQPQHLAFIFAYALGAISTSAAGTGYEHVSTPIDGDVDAYRSIPSFTAGMRYGKTVLKRLFASMFMDSFVCTFARDDWVKIVGQAKATGKVTTNIEEETLSALDNAVSLTLAANGVEGASAQARLDNMQRIRIELVSGTWTEIEYSAVSAATPAVITITSAGGAGDSKSYKLLYIPTESGWMTFPSRVSETPLRVSEVTFKLGGTWDGSDFNGGRELDAEVNSIEWTYNNNGEITYGLGADGAYANRYFRPARTQVLKLDREFRNYIIQNHIDENDYFGIKVLAEGAIYDSPHKYQSRIVFPRVGVISAPISVNGKVVAEVGDLQVLEDDTYGSVITETKNLQSTYAA